MDGNPGEAGEILGGAAGPALEAGILGKGLGAITKGVAPLAKAPGGKATKVEAPVVDAPKTRIKIEAQPRTNPGSRVQSRTQAPKGPTAAERAARARQLQDGIDNLDGLIGTDHLPSLRAELQALSKKLELQRELNKLMDLPANHGTSELVEQIDALLPHLK